MRKIDHDETKPDGSALRTRHPGVDVKLFDADMKEVGVNEPGEICVRGPLVMDGYWKRPEANAESCAAAGCTRASRDQG